MMNFPSLCYDNRFDDGTPVASTTATGYSVSNLQDWRAYTWWKPTALPATVTVDCGAAKTADYAVIVGHTLGTSGATLEVRGSTDNFVASDVLVATITPTSDNPILLQFASTSYRYWRYKITGGATMPAMAVAAIGTALEIPGDLAEGFDPLTRTVQGTINKSVQGHPLGRVFDYEAWSQDLNFGVITWDWLRASFIPAWKGHLRGSPCVFIWDPVSHSDELYLVTLGDNFKTPHSAGGYANLQFTVSGVHTS